MDAAQRAAAGCTALSFEAAFGGPGAGPGAGQLPTDAGIADNFQEPGAASSGVVGKATVEVAGPAGVVLGVPVGPVEVQQVDGGVVGSDGCLVDGGGQAA